MRMQLWAEFLARSVLSSRFARSFCVRQHIKIVMESSTEVNPETSTGTDHHLLKKISSDLGKRMRSDLDKVTGDVNKCNSNLACFKPSPRIRRRTRIDLGAQILQHSDKAIEEIGSWTWNSSDQKSDSLLPSSFGKNYATSSCNNSKSQTTYSPSEVDVRSCSSVEAANMDEPFDICPCGSREEVPLEASLQGKEGGNQTEADLAIEESGMILRPGMVLLKKYISPSEQGYIIKTCRELGLGQGGFYRPGYKGGAKLRLHMMCLGYDWDPQTRRYSKTRQYDKAEAVPIPQEFCILVRKAIHDSHMLIQRQMKVSNAKKVLPLMDPDICIVNFYAVDGRLGLHQDRDESSESLGKGLPVVSFSIGNSAEFLYGDKRDIRKAERVLLESGDVLIFGGKSRHVFHGVTSIIPNSAPLGLKLHPGRLNLTFRKY